MDVRDLEPEVWDQVSRLEASQPGSVTAEVLTWDGGAGRFVCVFLSADGSAHMMTTVDDDIEVSTLRSLRGLEIQVLKNHAVAGRDRQTYLDLRCTAPAFLLPFTRVVQDIGALVLRDLVPPEQAIERVAEAWRSFWSPAHQTPLSETEIRGLIGELYVLDALHEAGVDAASAWAGPAEDRHDFRTAVAALEVKTCLGMPRRHLISSLDQLNPSEGVPLFLVSIVLESAEGGSTTLPGMVDRVTSQLSAPQRRIFEAKLGSTGYTPIHRAEYERFTYVWGQTRGYRVSPTFPRITRDSFAQPLPAAVEKVQYVLNLETEDYEPLSSVISSCIRG